MPGFAGATRAVVAALALAGAGAPAAVAASYAEVAKILEERCVVCHRGEAAPNGLRLDSYAALMRGSQRGPVVRPGNAGASELVRRVRGESAPRMPLTGPPWLSDTEVAALEAWITAGAPPGDAAAAPPRKARQPGDPVTYADVAPLLVGRCAKCHGPNSIVGAPPEGYRLDTFETTLDASDRARVVPGNPAASELVRRARGLSLPRMPLDGPPFLGEEEILLIERWIAEGARDARGRASPVPVGARVRLGGTLIGPAQLDGLLFEGQPRRDRRATEGAPVQLRGIVAPGGRITAERLRPFDPSAHRLRK